jgi:hypothetical protein
MRRVPTPVVLVVLAVATWALCASISSAQQHDCIPKCTSKDPKNKPQACTCLVVSTNPDTTGGEGDSTMAFVGASASEEWGLATAFSSAAFTIGVHPWGEKVGSWMENTLEKPHSSPAPRDDVAILSVRATKEAADVFESGYAVSMSLRDEQGEDGMVGQEP